MYQQHFGLRTAPFGLTPDTEFFFPRASHQAALNMLLVALRSGEGFVKVTGEIGLGKTTLCRMLLRSLGSDFAVAYLPNPAGSRGALILMVAEELGCLPRVDREPEILLRTIGKRLIKLAQDGKRTVLVLDEAQAMPDEVLEAVRLLTNLETEHDKLLQVVLFGQPELDQRLARPELRQLRSRITFSHTLQPLDRAQFGAYVAHRLEVAGGSRDLFSPEAIGLIHRASRGVPRIGNILCHKSLLAAYGPGATAVGTKQALAAVNDTEGARHYPAWLAPIVALPGRTAFIMGGAVLLIASLAVALAMP